MVALDDIVDLQVSSLLQGFEHSDIFIHNKAFYIYTWRLGKDIVYRAMDLGL
jgi:hypothetical protein